MLNEIIEINCNKQQLEKLNECLVEQCKDDDAMIIWTRVQDGRLQFMTFSWAGGQ